MSSDSDYGCASSDSGFQPCLYLGEAVREGNLAVVQEQLGNGANANDVDHDLGGCTILHWAAAFTDEEVLIDESLDPYVLRSDRRAIVKALLDHEAVASCIWWKEEFARTVARRPVDMTGDEETKLILYRASLDQALASIEDSGSGPDTSIQVDDLATCFESIHFTSSEYWDNREIMSAGLHAAAALNKVAEIVTLVHAGADVNNDLCDETALSVASSRGCLEAVRILVETYRTSIDKAIDQNGSTAIQVAILRLEESTVSGQPLAQHEELIHLQESVVRFLLEKGADPFQTTWNIGPLTMLTHSSTVIDMIHSIMLDVLLSDAFRQHPSYDEKLKTAFDSFVMKGDVHRLRALLREGCSPPSDCLQRAVAFGRRDVLEVLLGHNALDTYDGSIEVNFYGSWTNKPTNEVVLECRVLLESEKEMLVQRNASACQSLAEGSDDDDDRDT